MKRFLNHARSYILRGLLAIIPIVLSALAIQFLYVVIDKRFVGLFNSLMGFSIPGLGILLVIVALYFIGLIASNVIGKQIFNVIENITTRIPLIKYIYQLGRQFSDSLVPGGKQSFKRSILVDVNGTWAVAFLTGSVVGSDGKEYYRVFIPTTPTPASGFVAIVKPEKTIDPKWSIEETLKVIISGGIVGPEKINI